MDIGTRIRRLWERSQVLAERDVEYIATGWARYRAESPMKSDLIEARRHLANAGIDLFTGHESGKARKELESTRLLLDQAEDREKKQLTELQKAVDELGTDPVSASESSYVSLQQQLGSMIQSL